MGSSALRFVFKESVQGMDGSREFHKLSQGVHHDCRALVYFPRLGSWVDTVYGRLCWSRTCKGVLLLQISFNYGNFSDIIRSVEDSPGSPRTPSLASAVIS